jgi:hypothetical protein
MSNAAPKRRTLESPKEYPRDDVVAILVTNHGNNILPSVPESRYDRAIKAVLWGNHVEVTTIYIGMVAPAKKPQRAMHMSINGMFVEIVTANKAIPAKVMPMMDKVKGFPPAFMIGPINKREVAVPTQNRERDVAVIAGDWPSSSST